MADQTIRVVITADGKEYALAVDRATGKTRKLSNEVTKTSRSFSLLKTNVSGVNNVLRAVAFGYG